MFQENHFLPYHTAPLPAGPWVVFAPHADDETFGMGGTLLLGARQGIAVTLVVLTDGSQGGDQTDLASIREAEAKEAARRLGVGETLFWRQRDRELRVTAALVAQVAELVQEKAPASVFFPSPFEPHPDHRAAAALVWAGLKSCGEFRGTAYAYEISVQGPVNRLIDITAVVANKRVVMAVYKSQLSQNRYVDLVLALNTARTYTLPTAVTHAEGFYAYEAVVGELAEQVIGSVAVNWLAQAEPATSRPLVSVIIRTRDRPVLLREALQSLATQTYAQLEAVVVNDGGRDVAEVVNAFAGRLITRVRYFNQQPGAGRSAAANVGLQNATGKYCLFLDDDDWLLPDHIDALVNVLERRQDIGVAYAGVRCVQQEDSGEWRQIHVYSLLFDPVRLLYENYIPIHAALFRRELIESGCRFDKQLNIYEDWDFWVQLSRKVPFIHVDRISAVYRISATSGFGRVGDSMLTRKAMERFFHKWRRLWKITDILNIAECARYKPIYFDYKTTTERQLGDLNTQCGQLHSQLSQVHEQLAQTEHRFHHSEEQLTQTRQQLTDSEEQLTQTRQQLTDSEEQLTQTCQQLARSEEQLTQTRQQLAHSEEQLTQTRDQWKSTEDQLTQTIGQLEEADGHIQRLSARVTELERSTSWKVTWPLRAATASVSQLKDAAHLSYSLLRRYLVLSYQILRAEGPGRLLERVADKVLYRRYWYKPQKPLSFQVATAWEPLQFATADHPLVSIVIPVHNACLYTFTCLQSIADNDAGVPFEIIVVDDHSEDETAHMLAAMVGVRVVVNEGERGFVHACNVGARQARGDYIVLLNNDTMVTSGWLRTLVDTFADRPRAGLIGVKLIYPDGRLQEAGGILWQDGSAWNYGRNDDPNKPQYNYLREVDYCSGACLAIPRQLFTEVGFFSEEFAPAYLEDADLAFKVKAVGKQVLYQPAVTIVHFEGASSGVRRLAGPKKFQVLNQEKLLRKWRAQLASHRVNGHLPELEKDRSVRRRVLIMDALVPTPDKDSGSLRLVSLFEIFQELDFKVTFAAANLEFRAPYGERLQRQGVEVIYAPFVRSVEDYLQTAGRYLAVVVMCRADVAGKYLDKVRIHAPSALVVFDTVDLHFLREQRMAEVEEAAQWADAAARQEQELALMRQADVTLVVSPVEKTIITEQNPDLCVEVLSNIHQVYGSARAFNEREGLLFVGNFLHPPNTDAVLYYVREILPLLRQQLGDVNSYIIGHKPLPKVKALASDTILVTGYVPDIAEYFAQCRLSVAPLRYGAGVKGKINLSMAYGVPVVATSVAVEGMYLTDGQDVIIGDSPVAFAEGVVKLYRDRELWERLSRNGLSNVREHFSKEAATRVLTKLLADHGLG